MSDRLLNYMDHDLDQGMAAIREFVARNEPHEINAVLARYVKMNQSDNPSDVLTGTLAGYALTAGIKAHVEAGGEF